MDRAASQDLRASRRTLPRRHDGEGTHVEPLIPRANPGGRPRETNMREAINAILYLLRTGLASEKWRALDEARSNESAFW